MQKGPGHREQLIALASGQYWTTLNTHLLNCTEIRSDELLQARANAVKHLLQVYGSNSDALPDYRPNEGKAKGHVFHAHIESSGRATFILEWAVIDRGKRLIALTNFGRHENFRFRKDKLKPKEIALILADRRNIRVMDNVEKQRKRHEAKCDRIQINRPKFNP